MNATDSTFEEYVSRLAAHGVAVVDHLDDIRDMYDRERLFARLCPEPDDMPPCPPWCSYEQGHRYESAIEENLAAGTMTLERFHEDTTRPGGSISQGETRQGGRVTLEAPTVLLDEVEMGSCLTAAEARQRAADLLNLADVLDGLAASVLDERTQ